MVLKGKIVDNEFKSLALKMINDFKLFSIEQIQGVQG